MPPVIPAPDGRVGVLSGLRRTALVVEIDGSSVLYQFDENDPFTVCVRVVDSMRLPFSELLDPIGRVAVSAEFDECIAVIYEWATERGSEADQALARRAIPHLYAELTDPAERKALRALYRRLTVAAS